MLQRAHSPLKANVFLDETSSPPAVIKDYSHAPRWLRGSLGRFVHRREINTLKKLAGIRGVPRYLEAEGDYAYRMEYIEGSLPSRETLGASPELLDQLAQIVRDMHAVGVTHNDLRPTNLILSADRRLFLIDFGAVVCRPRSRGFWARPGHWFFDLLAGLDQSKIARLKKEHSPQLLTDTEHALIRHTRFARSITRIWKRTVLPIISPAKHRKRP